MLYFLSCPFPAFHVPEAEEEENSPVGVFRGPADGYIHFQVEYDVNDVEHVENQCDKLHV